MDSEHSKHCIAVVTGSNKGVGFEIVRGLCKALGDGIVYLTARNESLGQAAVEVLVKQGLKPHFHQLDICDEASILKFRDYINEKYGGIDILVNNAGIFYMKGDPLPFKEQAFNLINVNFTGTLNVCEALFPLLRPHARVVNVSSSSGLPCRIPGEELRAKFMSDDLTVDQLKELTKQFIHDAKIGNNLEEWGSSGYVVGKVALSALTRIQHREFLNDCRPDIVINHVHPGHVRSDMTKGQGKLEPSEGAVAPLYLALLPEDTESPKGDFVWFDKKILDWKTYLYVSQTN